MNTKETITTYDKYAIFQTGGKQYQAVPGKTISIEKVDGEAGSELSFDTVLFRKKAQGDFEFGQPFVQGAQIKASIVKQTKGPKIIIFKHKRRKKYHVKKGHRQLQTIIRIENV